MEIIWSTNKIFIKKNTIKRRYHIRNTGQYPIMEKYIQQWINQEIQIIEHIKIQIIYQIQDRTLEEMELQKCKSRDKQRIQRKINHLWRHYFELYEAYNNINEFHKEITKQPYQITYWKTNRQ